MLPPEFAGLQFRSESGGDDEALAARVKASAPGQRVLVLGSLRTGLLRAIAGLGLGVVVVDTSRSALQRLQAELPADGPFTLLAQDPRELSIPGGASLALIPSLVWRAVILPDDRLGVLRSLGHALAPDGVLALDVERLPAAVPSEDAPDALPTGDGSRATWWRKKSGWDVVTVRVERSNGQTTEIDFAAFSPDRCLMELTRSGFSRQHVTDAVTSAPASPETARLWVVARSGDRKPA